MSWGAALQQYREAAGLTQVSFARLLGVHRGTVANWEAGIGKPMRSNQRRVLLTLGARYEAERAALRALIAELEQRS